MPRLLLHPIVASTAHHVKAILFYIKDSNLGHSGRMADYFGTVPEHITPLTASHRTLQGQLTEETERGSKSSGNIMTIPSAALINQLKARLWY